MIAEGRVPQRGRALVGDLRDRGRQGRSAGVRGEATAAVAGRVSIDPRTPCIVGVGSRTWHPADDGDAGAPEPLEMWEDGRRARPRPTPAPRPRPRSTRSTIVYCQTWQYDDPVDRLCERLGRRAAAPALLGHRRHDPAGARAGDGGPRSRAASSTSRWSSARRRSTPSAGTGSAGERYPYSFTAGREAARSRGRRRSIRPRSRTRCSRPGSRSRCSTTRAAAVSGSGSTSTARSSASSGIASRRSRPRTREAWFPVERSAEEIITPTPDEPHGRLPVHEVHGLDHGRRHGGRGPARRATRPADALGIAARPAGVPARLARTRPIRSTSPSIPICGARRRWRTRPTTALASAGVGIDDVAHLDLYSCFGSSVNFMRDALGIARRRPAAAHRHRRPAVPRRCRAATTSPTRSRRWSRVLRDDPGSYGLVSGVGMHMTKHVAGRVLDEPGPDHRSRTRRRHRRRRADRRPLRR